MSAFLGAAAAPLGQANALGQQVLALLDPTFRQATLRGLPFYVRTGTDTPGRRWVTHEFPGRDDPWHEDLGERTRRIDVEGLLIGDDVQLQAEDFLEAISAPGTASFTHPWFGQVEVAILDGRVVQSEAERRVAQVSLRLERAGRRPAPLIAEDSLAGILARLGRLRLAALRVLSRLRQLLALPRLLLGALRAFVNAVVAQFTGLYNALGRPFDQRGRPAGASLASVSDADLRSPAAFGPVLLDAYRGASVLTAPPARGEAPVLDGLWPSGAALPARDILPRLLALTAAPALPLELAAWRAVAQCAAASEAARVLAVMPFDSRPDAIAARDAVADAMASAADALAEAGLHDAWTEMLGLRAAVVQDTSARAARLPALRRIQLPTTLPAALVAYRLDGDDLNGLFGRAQALTSRNRLRHPLFVPGGRVLEVAR